MIIDHLDHAPTYEGLHPLFGRAFAYLRDFNPATADGRYEIAGADLFALVQRYRTDADAPKAWEDHRVYGDIQYLHAGCEGCGHTDARTLAINRAYDEAKDVVKFYPPTGPATRLTLSPGHFAVFFPGDAHQPCLVAEGPENIVKVVIKFRR